MELGKHAVVKKSGNEAFHIDGDGIDCNLLDFWRWSSSEILGNALRGILAEYIVSMDIRCPYEIKDQWGAYDLITSDQIKVEVKSSSYIQNWSQDKFSKISFGIQPTIAWEGNNRTTEFKRQSDVYVFCVLSHKDKKTIDPLNLNQWDFYVLPTTILDSQRPSQKSITLSSMLTLNPIKCKYGEISKSIAEALI